MATNLRINASSEPESSAQQRKRKSTDSHDEDNEKRSSSVVSDKYIHVHHYLGTGRWGTWFNDPTMKKGSGKRRMYFGTYATEYLAARAQDRAALKFKPYAVRPMTRLNFSEADYELDKELRDKLDHDQFRRLLMAESRKCYNRALPSPCWKIFMDEELAKGNIVIEHEDRSKRFQRRPRTFAEVLQDILKKNKAVKRIDEPVTTREEEGKVYTAKRSKRHKRHSQAAPNQPVEEVTKEFVAEDSAALPTRSLSTRQVRKASSVAARRVRHDSRSLSAHQVGKATPAASPRIRHDTRSTSLSARQASTPIRHDTRSASLSARQVPKAAPAVLRRDSRKPRQSDRPVRKGAPEALLPVRREQLIFKGGVRHAEGEGRSLAESMKIAVYLDNLQWGRTRARSERNFDELSLPNAASTDEATVVPEAADPMNMIMMAENILSVVPNNTAGTSDGKVALCNGHTTVENPSKRKRLSIDLNREPEPSSTASAVAPPHECDATGGNDDPKMSSAETLIETLILLKSGWLREVTV